MLDQLREIEAKTLKQLANVADSETLQELYGAVLGKKGELTTILRSVGQLPADQRPEVGQRANEVREALETAFAEREQAIRTHELGRSLEEGAIDVTLPGRPLATGRIHPANQTLREIYDIWAEMGFQVFRSRDVEDDETNFALLNMPPHHPA